MRNETRIVIDARMDAPEGFALAGGVAYVFSTRGPGKDGPNEDSALLVAGDDACGLIVVADGVGGQPAGASASKLTVESIARRVLAGDDGQTEMRARILDAIEESNSAMLQQGSGAATTVAAVEISDGTARAYHVGDSAVLVVGQRGRLKMQTVAHSPVGYAVEAGVLDEAEAMHHAERHIVSNVVGSDAMRIEVGSPLMLAAHDTVLVATDGLLDNLHAAEIVERIRCGPLREAAESLISLARKRMDSAGEGSKPGKPDDLTLILYRRGGKC